MCKQKLLQMLEKWMSKQKLLIFLIDRMYNKLRIFKHLLQILEKWMNKQMPMSFLIERMKKQLVIFKKLQNQQIRKIIKLENLLKLKGFLKRPVVILKIFMQKRMFILKCQLQDIEIIKTHIIHLNMLVLFIFTSKIPIK